MGVADFFQPFFQEFFFSNQKSCENVATHLSQCTASASQSDKPWSISPYQWLKNSALQLQPLSKNATILIEWWPWRPQSTITVAKSTNSRYLPPNQSNRSHHDTGHCLRRRSDKLGMRSGFRRFIFLQVVPWFTAERLLLSDFSGAYILATFELSIHA